MMMRIAVLLVLAATSQGECPPDLEDGTDALAAAARGDSVELPKGDSPGVCFPKDVELEANLTVHGLMWVAGYLHLSRDGLLQSDSIVIEGELKASSAVTAASVSAQSLQIYQGSMNCSENVTIAGNVSVDQGDLDSQCLQVDGSLRVYQAYVESTRSIEIAKNANVLGGARLAANSCIMAGQITNNRGFCSAPEITAASITVQDGDITADTSLTVSESLLMERGNVVCGAIVDYGTLTVHGGNLTDLGQFCVKSVIEHTGGILNYSVSKVRDCPWDDGEEDGPGGEGGQEYII